MNDYSPVPAGERAESAISALSSHSGLAAVAAWRRSRFPLSLYLPLAVLLVVAALVGAEGEHAARVLWRLGLALLLLLAFRLWDDLADRERDRRTHPERVLARVPSTGVFWLMLVVLLVVAMVMVATRHDLFVSWWLPLALMVAAVFYYNGYCQWWRGRRSLWPTALLPLIKYPCFVFVLQAPGPSTWPRVLAPLLVYATATIFEVLHDEQLRRTYAAHWVRMPAAAIFALATGLLTWGQALVAVAAASVAALATAAVCLLPLPSADRDCRRRGYLGFAWCFVVLALCLHLPTW